MDHEDRNGAIIMMDQQYPVGCQNTSAPVGAETLYFAAVVGDASRLAALLQRNQFPAGVRELARDIAAAGGHREAVGIILSPASP